MTTRNKLLVGGGIFLVVSFYAISFLLQARQANATAERAVDVVESTVEPLSEVFEEVDTEELGEATTQGLKEGGRALLDRWNREVNSDLGPKKD